MWPNEELLEEMGRLAEGIWRAEGSPVPGNYDGNWNQAMRWRRDLGWSGLDPMAFASAVRQRAAALHEQEGRPEGKALWHFGVSWLEELRARVQGKAPRVAVVLFGCDPDGNRLSAVIDKMAKIRKWPHVIWNPDMKSLPGRVRSMEPDSESLYVIHVGSYDIARATEMLQALDLVKVPFRISTQVRMGCDPKGVNTIDLGAVDEAALRLEYDLILSVPA